MIRRYQKELSRDEEMLFPPSLDEYVIQDNPVRAIDAYVDSLDLSSYRFSHTTPVRALAGQPPYPPRHF